MQINNIRNNTQLKANNNSFKGGREALRIFANPDHLATTIALETSVTGGRGINAYRRGGKDEFRERFIDDVVSAVFWMKGVDIFNKMGDWIGKNVLKLPFTEFDLGKDALRNPVKNLEKKIASTGVTGVELQKLLKKHEVFKLSKILTSSLLATAFVGFALPKINQALTERIMGRNKMQNKMGKNVSQSDKTSAYNIFEEHSFDAFDKKIASGKSTQSFKGIPIATVAHTLENNRIAKMLTTDVGILTGRVTTARNKDEAREYFFRDSMSPFFYYASTPLIYKGLQVLTGSEKSTSIDPVTAKEVHKNMLAQVEANGGTMNIKDFAEKTLGVLDEDSKSLLNSLPFTKEEGSTSAIIKKIKEFSGRIFKNQDRNKEVISLTELKKHIDESLWTKAEEMAKLQPEQAGVGGVLTKQQVVDVLKKGSVNSSEFMQRIYRDKFGEDLTNPLKYIPMKKITSFRENIDGYGQAVIEAAKKTNNGVVDKSLLERVSKSGFAKAAGFRIFAMAVSALFLGVIIPKMQYAMTARRTGRNAAPGLRQFEEEKKA